MVTDTTNINDIGLIFIAIMGMMTFIVPRRYALMPLLMSACYMTLGQKVVIMGLDFSIFRIMILLGWMRAMIRREYIMGKLNAVDKTIIMWVVVSILTNTLLWETSEAFINRLGFAYNAMGIYFLFRFFIRDHADIEKLIKILSIILVPLAILMLIEHQTGRNLFSIFGGVPEFTVIRGDKLRCQGPFRHPILAGTFGATLIPLFFMLWFRGRRARLLGIVGGIAGSIMTVTSASSGPAIAYLSGIGGLMMWPFRRHMRLIRWGVFLGIIMLHIIMLAPVWALIGRLSSIIGGTGWHRVEIINAAVDHFGEWWLIGTKSTAHWLSEQLAIDPTQVDITNQYIYEGVNGGLPKMILFIVIIGLCFHRVGRALYANRTSSLSEKMMVWSLGAALLCHVVTFISVSYFDQMIVIWYMVLAMVSIINKLSEKDEIGEKA